jgi:hypothetical protein
MQLPEEHQARLDAFGVKLTNRTTPELATVKLMYPKERWEEDSPTLTNWGHVLEVLHHCAVFPAEVPQWLRSPVADDNGQMVHGFAKVAAVLRTMRREQGREVSRRDSQEPFRNMIETRLNGPLIATIPTEGTLAGKDGAVVLFAFRTGGELKIFAAFDDQEEVRKIVQPRLKRKAA